MSNYFGIDLGTTNSAVVWNDPHRGFRTIGDPLDNSPTPSVVAIEIFNQQIEFGRAAKEQWLEMHESGQYYLIPSVKSCLDQNEVWPAGNGRFWQPEGIASALFRFLSSCTARVAGREIDRAVVAVPVGMSVTKRAILRRAAKAAGIDIPALISEPTAACIAHLEEIRHCRYIAVFDWGGGTLDISALELRDNHLTELHTIGWNKAGDDIDRLFAEWLHQQIAEEKRIKRSFDEMPINSQQALLNAAEECKRQLQQQAEAVIRPGKYGNKLVQQRVTQKEFNTLIKPIVREAVDRLFVCVEKAGISPETIGCLLLVGGSSKLTELEREIKLRWPSPNILAPEDAEWAIAKGAAILAANPGKYRLAESIGLRLDDNQFHAILPVGTSLDEALRSLHFGLVEDSRTASFIFERAKIDSSQSTQIGELHAETLGFSDEIIEIKSRVTEDLIFEATACSDKRRRPSPLYQYNELRWMYELPPVPLRENHQ